MKLIGKLDESLVYEVERGKYIIVIYDEEEGDGRCEVTSNWTNPLGRFAWSFTKCETDEKEPVCIDIISEHKSEIAQKLSQIDEFMKNEEYAQWVTECAIENEETLSEMREGETRYCD